MFCKIIYPTKKSLPATGGSKPKRQGQNALFAASKIRYFLNAQNLCPQFLNLFVRVGQFEAQACYLCALIFGGREVGGIAPEVAEVGFYGHHFFCSSRSTNSLISCLTTSVMLRPCLPQARRKRVLSFSGIITWGTGDSLIRFGFNMKGKKGKRKTCFWD